MSAKPQTMSTRASIMLAGEQSTRIDVHGARENGARLALLWGTLLLTFTAADQMHALLTAYNRRPAGPHQATSTTGRRHHHADLRTLPCPARARAVRGRSAGPSRPGPGLLLPAQVAAVRRSGTAYAANCPWSYPVQVVSRNPIVLWDNNAAGILGLLECGMSVRATTC